MMRDEGVSTVIGAVVVLAILGGAILYVNAFYVPHQGAAMETNARADARQALLDLQGQLTANRAPFTAQVPLAPKPGEPPLMAGVILSPARTPGALNFTTQGTTLVVSHLTDAPAGGVPANDPTRVAESGRMRVYDVGSAAGGVAMGSLGASVGGTYLAPVSYRLEGGGILAVRAGASSLVAAPSWRVASSANGSTNVLGGTLPILAGPLAEERGLGSGALALAPGAAIRAGAGQAVYNVTLVVHTDALAAWTAAMQAALGGRGTLAVVPDAGATDAGTITVIVLPPAGTPANVRGVTLDLTLVRASVAFSGATTG